MKIQSKFEPSGKLAEFIHLLGVAPPDQLSEDLSAEARTWDGNDALNFLRNFRDKCNVTGGASTFAFEAITMVIAWYPRETAEQRESRLTTRRALAN